MLTKTPATTELVTAETAGALSEVLAQALEVAAEATGATRARLVRGDDDREPTQAVPLGVDGLHLALDGARPRELGILDRAAALVRQAWVWNAVTGGPTSRSGKVRRRNFLAWLGEKLALSLAQEADLALLLIALEEPGPAAASPVYDALELEDRVPIVYNAVERAVRGVDSVYRCDDATLAVVLPRCDRANADKVLGRVRAAIDASFSAERRAARAGVDLRIYAFPDELLPLTAGVRDEDLAAGDPAARLKLWAALAAGCFRGAATVLAADARGNLAPVATVGGEAPSEVPRTADEVFLPAAAAVVPRAGAGERASLMVPIQDAKGPVGVLLVESIHGGFGPADLELGKRIAARLAGTLRAGAGSGAAAAAPEARRYRHDYEGIIGSSPAMQQVYELLDRVIDTDYPVIIQGESGTGKELVARAVHFNGRRRDKPLIAENCAALNENLLEAELFGYEKGSFTGAETSRKGLFELADGGTLFLDEVADMKIGMQKDLLRILQEGIVRPVGSKKFFHVDVRIICASNRDLLQLVEEGKFRSDLFYRLNVWSIHMPALRERREDVPQLVEHFLAKIAQQTGTPQKRLGRGVLEALAAYDWPGNVRELKNELTRMVALAPGDEVLLRDFSRRATGERERPAERSDEVLPLDEVEKLHILRALRHTNGNRSRAAELLGINKATIYRKLKSYGLD